MTMCRVLHVARAGFCAWLHNPVSARDKDNQRLLTLIRDSYSLSGGVYGYRRVHGDLNEIGETCGKNRVVKWFTEFGHLNRGDMLTSEQHRCHNEKKKFQRRV